MKIYIPSLHRMDQKTWEALPPEWQNKTTIICHRDDVEPLRLKYRSMSVRQQPTALKGIGPIRQYLLDTCPENKMVMMDDDLRFSARFDGTTKLRKADEKDMQSMMDAVEEALDDFAHCAVSAREGNNHVLEDATEVGRPLRFLAYNRLMVKPVGARFDRIELMEDFDMTLQLLRVGLPNCILWSWAHDQVGGSNAKGGCSTYRTGEKQAEAARTLAALHPGFVKVVEKETKGAWKGLAVNGKRTDVQISWKKAFDASTRRVKLVIRKTP